MTYYYGPGMWSNIYSIIALCVFASCLQWDYKWKRVDNHCGQFGPNLIIPFQSGFVFLGSMYFLLLSGNTLNLTYMSLSVRYKCVYVYGNACTWVNQEITLSIDDILYIYSTNLHVHIVHVLNLTECMSNVLNLAVSAVTGAAKSYEKS